ncbi:hypothetical protein HYDPIDRAFT_28493 [Hydnomerulius pinastri MD-312]|uniref:Uncharacterized protein n=1 Tax=Hydnomerulius pinastri MD-312 TaxID=994086 RepID=A0A0C9W9R1_9AGAM|nr:hypothetical protein HYDPIDRAFT_28493 [Hydnomerulius pinastri MD-312]
MPPPSIIPVRATLAERMSIERIDTDMSSPDPPYVKAEPSSPSAADISSSHSLLMIEQQRRQELLARKAVIASRKARQNDSTASSIVKDQDVDMTSVPSQSVDDFLKSIEPVSHSGGNDGTHVPLAPTSRFLSPENMDVDESIPGLIGTSGDSSTFSAGPSSATSTSSASTITHMEPNSPATLPPGSTTDADSIRSNSTHYAASTASLDVADSYSVVATSSYSSFDGDSGHPQRRGTKRPVAADFVDFDSGPGRGSYTNGYSNGGAYPNPLSRRKTGSFAGISGMRRCVIELSDSEDDGDGEMMGEYGLVNGDGREYSPAVVGSGGSTSTRHPPRLTATPTMSSSFGFANGSAGLATPPSTFASPSTGFGAMSPAALVEKEQEIRKMRQLIAQREELRLKKLAAMSSKLLPTMPAPASSTTVTVKDEEMSVEPSSLLPSQQRASGQNVQSRNSTITHVIGVPALVVAAISRVVALAHFTPSPDLAFMAPEVVPVPHYSRIPLLSIIAPFHLLRSWADQRTGSLDVSGMADTSSMSPHTTDNSATAPTPDPSGETGDRRDLSATETSTIGSLSRFSASPTAG